MRAVRLDEGKVSVIDTPAPTGQGDGVRVRVRSAGICGSDLHMVAGGFPVPHTLGHEIAGVTDDGTPVAIEPVTPCGSCAPCARGEYNLCVDGPAVVLGVGRDGGMAEQVCVPERCLVPLPASVRVEDACIVEPLAVAVHGLRRARVRPGASVAVIGGGAIGLCAVAAAHAAGCSVQLVARHDAQREAGARLGASDAERDGVDVTIDAAGTASALEQAVTLTRPGGRLLLLASYWEGLVLPGFAVSLKEVDVIPSSMYARDAAGRDIDQAAALLASRPAIATSLITHRLPLEAAPEAFEIAAQRSSGAIKVVLEPGVS